MSSLNWATQLARASSWIEAHLEEFFVDRSAGQILPSVKAVAELAHAGEILTRLDEPRWHDLGRRWVEYAWQAIDEGDVVEALIRSNPRLVLAATTLLPFVLAGRRHQGALRAIAEQHLKAALNGLEWTLVVNAMATLGVTASDDVVERARAASMLARRPEPAGLALQGAYLLIHECLYLSRWGASKVWPDAEQNAYLEIALPALVERFLRAGDADMVSELALATHTGPFMCIDPEAWTLVAARQESDGAVSAPPRAITFLRRANREFCRRYHTTLVAVMAWALCPHVPRLV